MIKNIKSVILDMDGVLWRAKQPIGDLQNNFARLNNAGIKFAFATNNASQHTEDYVEKFADLGIEIIEDQVFTSAKATAQLLASRYPDGGNLYILGMDGMIRTFNDYGFEHSDGEVLAVVVGIDLSINYPKLAQATFKIRDGVPFIGTNPDVSFPTPYGQAPGAGSIIAALAAASEVEPEIVGKPMSTMFEQALSFLGTTPEETIVVGDRIETDIVGGQNAGCKTCLVLSGVTSKEKANSLDNKPDFIVDQLSNLIELIERQ